VQKKLRYPGDHTDRRFGTSAVCQAVPTDLVLQELGPSQIAIPEQTPTRPKKQLPEAPGSTTIDPNQETLHQTPRIMGVLPNFTAVDSNTQLPRLTTHQKFVVAMHDSVDYSSFLLVAGLAGKGLYSNSIPALGSGAAGFGRYYWREFTDQVSGTFFTEAIFPTFSHEDPRYYTLGKNGFFRRTSGLSQRVRYYGFVGRCRSTSSVWGGHLPSRR